MERSEIPHDEIEEVAVTPRRTGSSTAMTPNGTILMTSLQGSSAGDITREALHLALSALQIDLAWHAGVTSAEAAMECLHHEIGETVRRRNESTRTSSAERADLPHAPGTHTTLRPHLR